MFKQFNSNPQYKNKRDGSPRNWRKPDCAVRAVSCALGISWSDAYKLLAEKGLKMFTVMNDTDVIYKVLEDHGFTRQSFGRGMKPTVKQFARSNKSKVCVVHVCGHVLVTKNGDFYDTNDYAENNKVCSWVEKSIH